MYVTAHCPSSHVPFSPIPYQVGTLTCTYTAFLPFGWNSWPSSNPAAWTSVQATATISMSGAKCSSASTPISGNCWGLSSDSQWTDVATAATSVGLAGPSMNQPGMVNTPVIGTGSVNQQQGTVNTPVMLGSGSADTAYTATTNTATTNTATATTATTTGSTGNRKLLQSVQYVPQGCSGLTVAATAHFSGNNIVGSVTLSNPNSFDIPITQVQVELANNIPVGECQAQGAPASNAPHACFVALLVLSMPRLH